MDCCLHPSSRKSRQRFDDLAGNSRLSFDHIFIKTSSPDNPFQEKRETRSLFAPRAKPVILRKGHLINGRSRNWRNRRK